MASTAYDQQHTRCETLAVRENFKLLFLVRRRSWLPRVAMIMQLGNFASFQINTIFWAGNKSGYLPNIDGIRLFVVSVSKIKNIISDSLVTNTFVLGLGANNLSQPASGGAYSRHSCSLSRSGTRWGCDANLRRRKSEQWDNKLEWCRKKVKKTHQVRDDCYFSSSYSPDF